MATLAQLSDRLRAEIGDIPRSFVDTFTGDGVTSRYQLTQAPVQGYSLVVKVTTPSVTATVTSASANGTVVTYNAINSFTAGQTVSIAGLSNNAFNLTNVIIATRSSTQFTVNNTATGSSVTGATAIAIQSATTVDVSSNTTIEEGVGVLTFALSSIPANNTIITISGQAYRYFTDSEISYYVNTAFFEHSQHSTDTAGSRITQIAMVPPVEQYPLVILASTLALYTLATDSSFDIDISSPDGVQIPRSERFRQLMQIVETRKAQYKELCAMLNIGVYRIEVATLRRISRLTNRYIPIYRPQEVDDGGLPQRVRLSIPDYGDITPPSTALEFDLSMYSGDDFSKDIQFGFDLSTYTPKAQVVLYTTGDYAQIGPVVLATFTIVKLQSTTGGIYDTLRISMTGTQTKSLPKTSYYDLQLTANNGTVHTYMSGKIFTHPEVTT